MCILLDKVQEDCIKRAAEYGLILKKNEYDTNWSVYDKEDNLMKVGTFEKVCVYLDGYYDALDQPRKTLNRTNHIGSFSLALTGHITQKIQRTREHNKVP